MKSTLWRELDWCDCTVTRVCVVEDCEARWEAPTYAGPGEITRYQIRHPSLPRARWFDVSRRGNLYSRYTGKDWREQPDAIGYIIANGPVSHR